MGNTFCRFAGGRAKQRKPVSSQGVEVIWVRRVVSRRPARDALPFLLDSNAVDPHYRLMVEPLESAAEQVEIRSAVFRKELSLADLVFSQVILIVGPFWIGSAGKLGAAH